MENFLSNFKITKLFIELQRQISLNNFSHATLISSNDKMSLSNFSRLLALTLCCNKACLNCESCIKAISGTHPDILIYPKGKQFLVSDALDIVDNAYKKPIFSNLKVFVINNVDESIAGQNKILKILEEPPANVFFILTTTNTKMVLETILSRVQVHSLAPFTNEELIKILNEHNLAFSENLINFSEGHLGKAIELINKKDFEKIYNFAFEIFTKLKSSKDIINYSKQLADKENFTLILELLIYFYRQALYFYNNQKTYLKIDYDSLGLNSKSITEIVKQICEAEKAFNANVNINLICDNLLLHILEEKYLWK